MNQEKWEELKLKVKKQFGIISEGEEKTPEGKEIRWIEFKSPKGEIRLEYVIKPKVLGIKTVYSRRAGTTASVIKPITSSEDKVQYLKVYQKENNKWKEIPLSFNFQ